MRVRDVGIVEIAVERGGIGEALRDVAQVGAVAAVAEENLALPDVVARIGAAGDCPCRRRPWPCPSRG